jgi:hypothetical protein
LITHYFTEYGHYAALSIFAIAGISLLTARHIISGTIVLLSSTVMLALRAMHEISFNQDMVSHIKDENGQVVAFNIEMTPWQSASLWVDPLGFILISLSLLLLANQAFQQNIKSAKRSI